MVFDEIADGGKASDSCPLGVSRKGGKRAAVVDFQVHHHGSGHGVQGEYPPELALTWPCCYFADDALALGGHGQRSATQNRGWEAGGNERCPRSMAQ